MLLLFPGLLLFDMGTWICAYRYVRIFVCFALTFINQYVLYMYTPKNNTHVYLLTYMYMWVCMGMCKHLYGNV